MRRAIIFLATTLSFITICSCNDNLEIEKSEAISEEKKEDEVIISEEGTIVSINEEYFPDEVFREYISKKFDANKDNTLDEEEIGNITYIYITGVHEEIADCYYVGIKSLKGIELFPNLEQISVGFEEITEIDVSNNPKLKYLEVAGNPISKLDISYNPKLVDNINQNAKFSRILNARFKPGDDQYTIPIVEYGMLEESGGERRILEYNYGVELITGDLKIEKELTDERE